MNTKISILSVLFFMVTIYSNAQLNLVVNPSFEVVSSCPNSVNQVFKAVGWNILLTGGGGTPDLYHTCCQNVLSCGVPSSMYSFQYPKTGEAYVGLHAATESVVNKREYIQSKLLYKLDSGTTYCVTFYANLWDTSSVPGASINTLGAYFDNGEILTLSNNGLAYANTQQAFAIPQVYNTTYQLNDMLNWMKIEGSFTANGTEEFITIGNFFPDSLSGLVVFNPNATGNWWVSYYNIDDVSVIDISAPAYAGNDTTIHAGDSIFIGRQPEIGLNEACIWFVNGTPIDTIAGLWITPDTTTTYILQQTLCGNVSYDTITVTMDFDVGIAVPPSGVRGAVRLYPNPNDGNMVLEYSLNNYESGKLSISDITGKSISDYDLSSSKNTLLINENKLIGGVYFATLSINGKHIETVRLVVIK